MLDFTKTLKADEPLIHPTCTVNRCTFGEYVELGDNCIANDCHVGSYTYLFGHNDVYNAQIGKFNSSKKISLPRIYLNSCVNGTQSAASLSED